MDVIKDKYERWLRSIKPEDTPDELYEKAEEEARLMDYMAEDISLLSKDLKEFEKEEFFSYGGFYLSALSNSAQEGEIILHVQDIGKKISSLGYKNKKVLVVEGDIGNLGGYKMEGGKMVVKGDARNAVGNLMRGGRIIIEGNAGELVGWNMLSGEIWVKGTIKSICDVRGGKIVQFFQLGL